MNAAPRGPRGSSCCGPGGGWSPPDGSGALLLNSIDNSRMPSLLGLPPSNAPAMNQRDMSARVRSWYVCGGVGHTAGEFVFLLLEFEDAFLDRVGDDEARDHHRQLLAQPVGAVNRLLFRCGLCSPCTMHHQRSAPAISRAGPLMSHGQSYVPPGVEQVEPRGRREVEAEPALPADAAGVSPECHECVAHEVVGVRTALRLMRKMVTSGSFLKRSIERCLLALLIVPSNRTNVNPFHRRMWPTMSR